MSRARVLLLEDDVALRGLLFEALTAEDFDVLGFDNIGALRQAVASEPADLIVADFWGGGQRTLLEHDREEIRALAQQLPVILLTGRSWAAQTSADELGARALMRKPFDLEDLLDTVARALQQ
jgi:DNA-binding NtrC family response regulator